MKDKLLLTSLLLALALGSSIPIPLAQAAANDAARPAGNTDSGAQLNRTREYLERQNIARKIQEGWEKNTVEGTAASEKREADAVRFVLSEVEIPASQVLKPEELQTIIQEYKGKEISINDLYALVGKINKLYQEKGYMTCRAYLAPQTIHQGHVKIDLYEGKNGELEFSGRKTTRKGYIRDRLHIQPGEIQNMNQLNKDILRFNATNDAQLHIILKAGKEPGTTDYVIAVREPQDQVTGVFVDDAGNKTSGEYRVGMYWQDRNLLGNRDHLFISTLRSQGTKAVAASYNTPVNTRGTRAGVSYTTNSVHITDGPFEALGVKGHSYLFTGFLVNPIETTENYKSEWGLEYGHQRSQTDLGTNYRNRIRWANDTLDTVMGYYDQLNYGTSYVMYQKYGYRFGRYENLYNKTRDFGIFEFNGLYQRHIKHGQEWLVRLDGQVSSTQYLPSAEMYYLGGMYSVRGYKESLIAGDSGFSGSVEYTMPMDTKRKVKGYVFLDGGHIWGDSAYGDRNLMGAGAGIKWEINPHMSLNTALAFPLIRTINSENQSRTRIHFSFNSAF